MRYGLMQAFTMHHTQIVYGVPSPDRRALIETAQRLGFDGVELGLDRDFEQDPLWYDTPYQRSIRETAERLKVEVRSICLHLLNYQRFSPASEEAEHREAGWEILRKTMHVCEAISASVILIPFFGTSLLRTRERVEHLIREIRRLAPAAESLGVILALETSLDAKAMRSILDAIGSDSVGVYFDTGNPGVGEETLVQEIRILGAAIAQVHVKNHPVAPVLTDGQVHLPPVLQALREVGFDGYLVIEVPASDEATTRANLEALRLTEEQTTPLQGHYRRR